MTTRFESVTQELAATPRKWLVTGCAGFIGSNLLETLLKLTRPSPAWTTSPPATSVTWTRCRPPSRPSNGRG